MIFEGREWLCWDTPLSIQEVASAPDTPPEDQLKFYAKDKSGVSALYYLDDAGVEHDLSLVPASAAALTKTDDTNVTLTLGGSPTTALLAATSLTLGWTGQLSVARGGTAKSALSNVTAGSTKITLGGTPTAAVIEAFSIDVAEGNLTHNNLGGLTIGDPHTQYRLESEDHSHQSSGLQAGQLDHGLALTGLGDDDHALYLLASDATNRATFASNWLDLTDGGATTLHSHSGGSGHTIRENGTDQTARTGLNFIDADAGAGLITDDAGGDETEVNLSLYRLEAQDHSHQSTGLQAGQLTEAALSLSDVTTLNSATTQHGLLKKLSNVVTEFMNGTGNWSTPSSSFNYGLHLSVPMLNFRI